MRRILMVTAATLTLQGCAVAAVPAVLAGTQLADANDISQRAETQNCKELVREWRLAGDAGLLSPKAIYAKEIRKKNCKV